MHLQLTANYLRICICIGATLYPALWVNAEIDGPATWNSWDTFVPVTLSTLQNSAPIKIRKVGTREIWIATLHDVYVVDSQQLSGVAVEWIRKQAIPVKRVLDFFGSQDNGLYLISIKDGLYKLNRSRLRFEPMSVGAGVFRNTEVKDVLVQPTNTALFTTQEDLLFLQLDTEKFGKIPLLSENHSLVPLAIAMLDKESAVVVTSRSKVVTLIWQNDRYIMDSVIECPANLNNSSWAVMNSPEELWVFERGGRVTSLSIANGSCLEERKLTLINEALKGARISSVRKLTQSSRIAISTDKGLVLTDVDRLETLSIANSQMQSNDVLDTAEAGENKIWIGTFPGIIAAHVDDVTKITQLGSEVAPSVVAVASSHSLGSFIATPNSLYSEEELVEGVRYSRVPIPRGPSTISALSVTDQTIWVGYQNGDLLYGDTKTGFRWHRYHKSSRGYAATITGIISSPGNENSSLLSTIGGGILEAKNGVIKHLDVEQKNDSPTDYFSISNLGDGGFWAVDSSGVKFFAGEDGELNLTSTQRFAEIKEEHIPGAWILRSTTDSIYFGNPGGEISVARNFWDASQRSKTQELISTIGEPVYAIEVDSRDRLWIGAKSGIRVLGGNGQPLATYETGLFDQISVDYGASHITSDGIVFFGGSGGLIRIDTQEPLNIRSRSALYLSQVTLGERTHTLSNQRSLLRSILITEQDQPIEIVLRADILSSRYRRGVRFILEGFDSNWTNSGPDNSASYKHLPPGDYVFRARGADSFGVWSQNEIALPIHVKPPAWLSWWAFVGYAVLALAFAWLVKELNDRRVVAAVRRERAEDEAAAFARLQDDFQAQLEDNERLRGASVERAQRLLDVLSDAVDAKAQDQRDQGNAGADKELSEQIDCLRLAQSVTHSIAGRECCDLHAFVNELSTRLSSRGRQFANTIVINDVSAQPIDAGHSLYLALILYETLHQAYQNTLANKELGAIVTVTLPSPELDGTGELRYELRVTDNGVHLKQERMHTAGGAFIAHLQEAGIAEAHVSHEIGTEVLIGFHLPGDESRAT